MTSETAAQATNCGWCGRRSDAVQQHELLTAVPVRSAAPDFMRVPRPAAGRMTDTFMVVVRGYPAYPCGCAGAADVFSRWLDGVSWCGLSEARGAASWMWCRRSSKRPKIILPAVVCSTEVTLMSMFLR